MKNLNFPWNGVLRFGPKQFESVASADWVCDAVHDFLFIINIISKEGTEICGCMFAGYEGSACEFDQRLLSVQDYISWCIYPDSVPYCNSGIPFVFLSVVGWYGKCTSSCQKSACRQHKVLQSIELFSLFWCVEACFDVAKHDCHKENK